MSNPLVADSRSRWRKRQRLERSSSVGDPGGAEEALMEEDETAMADLALHDREKGKIFSRIAPAKSSKEAWDSLQTEFQGTPQVRLIKLQSLRREYENLKMNEGDNIKVFTEKLIDLGNQLRVHGEEKTDYQIVQKILISLPARFDSIVAVMKQTKDLTSLPVTELIGTLKAHEKRVEARGATMSEGAFNVRTRGGKSGFKSFNNQSHGYQGKGKRWCGFWNFSKCGIRGHGSREFQSKRYERAHMSLEDEDEDDGIHMLFSASEENPTPTKEAVWLIDSVCTNHMTKEESYFTRPDRSVKVPIRVGNGEIVMTAGKGDIIVMTNRGKRVIKDVFLVPGVEKNLINVP
ncbi:PREDICTED: uncharacterized protein LOC104743593 [Camelina sativa]|uniref:Uncharacterized protein LOC104743593 n=1 Tax=Camelina sativa TaxID=90675 RepID=A0ABM0VY90_CAMSA|nr:PREDICTED: uncharacterized protein LOC104743593 [Camelina sativa]